MTSSTLVTLDLNISRFYKSFIQKNGVGIMMFDPRIKYLPPNTRLKYGKITISQ